MFLGIRASSLVTALCCLRTVFAAECATQTILADPPSGPPTSTPVALSSYSYCGGYLNVTVFIENLCYNKIVTLDYTDGDGNQTPLTALSLGYFSSIPNTNFEYWGVRNVPAYIDGITKFTVLTYNAVDINKIYNQTLNLNVVASGDPPPTAASAPQPYASPLKAQKDITTWLKPIKGSEASIAKDKMFANINVAGAVPGTVIAAQSYTAPDYAFNWVRDSSLTFDVVYDLYQATTKSSVKHAYETLLFEYAKARAQEQNDPNLTFAGLGEPKFYLNNSAFTGPWGRPQNDGPATSAITLIEFANAYLAKGGKIETVRQQIYDSDKYPLAAPVKRDLLFVAANWTAPSFDLWEEEKADHFYTRMVQRRSLILGAAFATRMGDSALSAQLTAQANAIGATLPGFYNKGRGYILYENGPVLAGKSSYLDVAVILGVIHGYAGDGVYSYTNDQVLATAYKVATSFLPIYPIAKITKDNAGQPLGIPVGRYPEDIYDGVSTSRGNPWYLCTTTIAELFYRAATEYRKQKKAITVTSTSEGFWKYFAPTAKYTLNKPLTDKSHNFDVMIDALNGWGDALMRRVKYHTPGDGSLSEEYDRDTGRPVGAKDLTWSYAALLTASFARAESLGERSYVKDLANLS